MTGHLWKHQMLPVLTLQNRNVRHSDLFEITAGICVQDQLGSVTRTELEEVHRFLRLQWIQNIDLPASLQFRRKTCVSGRGKTENQLYKRVCGVRDRIHFTFTMNVFLVSLILLATSLNPSRNYSTWTPGVMWTADDTHCAGVIQPIFGHFFNGLLSSWVPETVVSHIQNAIVYLILDKGW